MANTPKVFVLCENNCRYESLTKEQIYTAIIEALENGTVSNIDTGFVQTIKTINNIPLKFFVGTQNSYDALTEEQKENLFAIISDDTSKADLTAYLEELRSGIDSLEARLNVHIENMFAVATYTPTEGNPLYCGESSKGSNKFTVELPRGKTLANLMCVMVKHGSATMVCMPFAIDGGMKCYGRGETHPARGSISTYSCELGFEEADGKITGHVISSYIGSTKFDKDTQFINAYNVYTGSDYIRLFFY